SRIRATSLASTLFPYPTLFRSIGEMYLLHLVEGRVLAQKLHGAVDVLQHRRLPGLGEGVSFAHGSPSVFWTWCAAEGSGHIGRKSSRHHQTGVAWGQHAGQFGGPKKNRPGGRFSLVLLRFTGRSWP